MSDLTLFGILVQLCLLWLQEVLHQRQVQKLSKLERHTVTMPDKPHIVWYKMDGAYNTKVMPRAAE